MRASASRKRLAALSIVLALMASMLIPGTAAAGPSGPIYFWANLGNPVKSPVRGLHNPPVIRPSSLLLFEDGSWLIEKLHWTGWGSPVAVAQGKSNSDNDKPNVAKGKRIITPAKVTLYKPGVFEGRRVYRCIRIKLQPPAHYEASCLERSGSTVGLGPPGVGTPVGGEAAEGAARRVDESLPACTKRALTKGLRNGGLRGYIPRDTFGCAGNFAYAGVIVDDNEVTVLFRARGSGWHPVDRGRYCENGSVPKAIYRLGCESN